MQDTTPRRNPQVNRSWILLMAAVALAVLWWQQGTTSDRHEQISYTEFHRLVDEGEVAEVRLRGQEVSGELRRELEVGGTKVVRFVTNLPAQEDPELMPLLREKG